MDNFTAKVDFDELNRKREQKSPLFCQDREFIYFSGKCTIESSEKNSAEEREDAI